MNNGVINSSEKLREYRGQLEEAINQLKKNLKKTDSAIEQVGEKWKDDNYKEFQENFSQDKEKIPPLCNVLDDYQANTLHTLEINVRSLEDHPFNC